MAKPYSSREFCKHIKCKFQDKIDNGDEKTREKIKDKKCSKCKAYQFHQYLKDNNYSIVDFGKSFVDEEGDKK